MPHSLHGLYQLTGSPASSGSVSGSLDLKNIEDIHIFGMNMPFISSSEAKNAYFMSGDIIYNFKRNRCFALNDVIHLHTLRHINEDVA